MAGHLRLHSTDESRGGAYPRPPSLVDLDWNLEPLTPVLTLARDISQSLQTSSLSLPL